jgi:hypothetical protein
MKLKEGDIEIRFVAPKALADKLDRIAKAEYCFQPAVLRKLLAQASVPA